MLDDKDEFENWSEHRLLITRNNIEKFIEGSHGFATEDMMWRYGEERYPFTRFKGMRMAAQYLKVCGSIIDEDLRAFHAGR